MFGVRTTSLDPFTVDLRCRYLAVLDDQRAASGSGYDARHNKLLASNGPRTLPRRPFALVAGVGFEPTTSGL